MKNSMNIMNSGTANEDNGKLQSEDNLRKILKNPSSTSLACEENMNAKHSNVQTMDESEFLYKMKSEESHLPNHSTNNIPNLYPNIYPNLYPNLCTNLYTNLATNLGMNLCDSAIQTDKNVQSNAEETDISGTRTSANGNKNINSNANTNSQTKIQTEIDLNALENKMIHKHLSSIFGIRGNTSDLSSSIKEQSDNDSWKLNGNTTSFFNFHTVGSEYIMENDDNCTYDAEVEEKSNLCNLATDSMKTDEDKKSISLHKDFDTLLDDINGILKTKNKNPNRNPIYNNNNFYDNGINSNERVSNNSEDQNATLRNFFSLDENRNNGGNLQKLNSEVEIYNMIMKHKESVNNKSFRNSKTAGNINISDNEKLSFINNNTLKMLSPIYKTDEVDNVNSTQYDMNRTNTNYVSNNKFTFTNEYAMLNGTSYIPSGYNTFKENEEKQIEHTDNINKNWDANTNELNKKEFQEQSMNNTIHEMILDNSNLHGYLNEWENDYLLNATQKMEDSDKKGSDENRYTNIQQYCNNKNVNGGGGGGRVGEDVDIATRMNNNYISPLVDMNSATDMNSAIDMNAMVDMNSMVGTSSVDKTNYKPYNISTTQTEFNNTIPFSYKYNNKNSNYNEYINSDTVKDKLRYILIDPSNVSSLNINTKPHYISNKVLHKTNPFHRMKYTNDMLHIQNSYINNSSNKNSSYNNNANENIQTLENLFTTQDRHPSIDITERKYKQEIPSNNTYYNKKNDNKKSNVVLINILKNRIIHFIANGENDIELYEQIINTIDNYHKGKKKNIIQISRTIRPNNITNEMYNLPPVSTGPTTNYNGNNINNSNNNNNDNYYTNENGDVDIGRNGVVFADIMNTGDLHIVPNERMVDSGNYHYILGKNINDNAWTGIGTGKRVDSSRYTQQMLPLRKSVTTHGVFSSMMDFRKKMNMEEYPFEALKKYETNEQTLRNKEKLSNDSTSFPFQEYYFDLLKNQANTETKLEKDNVPFLLKREIDHGYGSIGVAATKMGDNENEQKGQTEKENENGKKNEEENEKENEKEEKEKRLNTKSCTNMNGNLSSVKFHLDSDVIKNSKKYRSEIRKEGFSDTPNTNRSSTEGESRKLSMHHLYQKTTMNTTGSEITDDEEYNDDINNWRFRRFNRDGRIQSSVTKNLQELLNNNMSKDFYQHDDEAFPNDLTTNKYSNRRSSTKTMNNQSPQNNKSSDINWWSGNGLLKGFFSKGNSMGMSVSPNVNFVKNNHISSNTNSNNNNSINYHKGKKVNSNFNNGDEGTKTYKRDKGKYQIKSKNTLSAFELKSMMTEADEILLKKMLESLYDDRILPLLFNLNGRAEEMDCNEILKNNLLTAYRLYPEIYNIKKSETTDDYTVLFIDREVTDTYFIYLNNIEDNYSEDMWNQFIEYLKKITEKNDPSLYEFSGGRYGMAKELKNRNLPFFKNLCLGELCHIVHLSTIKKLIAYEHNFLKPVSKCYKYANAKLGIINSTETDKENYITTIEELKYYMRELLKYYKGSFNISTLKKKMKTKFNKQISESVFHCIKLIEVLQLEEMKDVCVVDKDLKFVQLVKK